MAKPRLKDCTCVWGTRIIDHRDPDCPFHNDKETTMEAEKAVLTVQIKFNGPVNDEGLDMFTSLLDQELGHINDVQEQRVFPKSDRPGGGWGMGTSMVMDVERVLPVTRDDVELLRTLPTWSSIVAEDRADETTVLHKHEKEALDRLLAAVKGSMT